MTRGTWTGVAAGLAALLCGGPVAADLAQVRAAGMLRVLVTSDEAPEMFALHDAGKPGFERELLEGFARLHRLKLEVVPVERFEDVLPGLVGGRGDVATGILDTADRRRQVSFTVEILPARLVTVSRAPQTVHSLAELAAERVAVVEGTAWGAAAVSAGVPAGNIRAYADMPALFTALGRGEVGAAVISLSDFVLQRRRIPGLVAGPFVGSTSVAAWAVRKADPELRRALDDYITNIRRTPSWSRMAVDYFGPDALTLLGRAKTEKAQ